MCLCAIYWARASKIYYNNTKKDAADINFNDDFIYKEIDRPIDQRKLPTIQILKDEAKVD
jgi:guanine deaminase